MLESYIKTQPIMYKIIVNSLCKNRISHAYLIETNYNSLGFDFALSIAKFLLCPLNKTKNNNCVNCTQCERIDKNCFSELKILKSESFQIKKEQISSLQKEFELKAIETNKKIYIIEEAEKLNESSSASLLKFLEEPEENIIAILITPNRNLLLSTILSRCQIISMKNNNTNDGSLTAQLCDFLSIKESEKESFIQNEDNDIKIDMCIKFLKNIDKNGIESLLYINRDWNKIFLNKDDYLFCFSLFVILYKKAIELKINKKTDSLLDDIVNNNSLISLCSKLDLVLNYKDKIKYNLNLNMLMDKFIIDMEGIRC